MSQSPVPGVDPYATMAGYLPGVVEGLWQGQVLYGWAADPQDSAARPIIRLVRGLELLAETVADFEREDGRPGFQLQAPWPVPPAMLLDGRIRVRAMLPGRHAAVTLAMSPTMRRDLEAPETPQVAIASEPALPDPAPRIETSRPSEGPPPPAPDGGWVEDMPSPAEANHIASPRREQPWPNESPTPPAPDVAWEEDFSAPFEARPIAAPHGEQPWPQESPMPPAPDVAWAQDVPAPAEMRPIAPPPIPPVRQQAPVPPAAPATDRVAAVSPAIAIQPVREAEQPAPPGAAQKGAPDAEPGLPFPLSACLDLARRAAESRVPTFHLLLPRRADVLAAMPGPGLAALEAAAAAEPLLAQDWVPLRHGFRRYGNPAALWRQDGRTLAVEGSLALLDLLLSVFRLRFPNASVGLASATRLLARADLPALPRRAITLPEGDQAEEAAPGLGLLGRRQPETEPALPADLFADLPVPRLIGAALPGLETWSQPTAPLPWRVVVMAEPGLGGSGGPALPGWWLRHLVAECVLSEALHIAAPEAVLAAAPDVLVILAAEPG